MKKIVSIIFALFMALSINAAERGKFIHVDASVNKNLKPQLAFAQTHVDGEDITTLLVQTVNVNNYNEFSDASRILMRFADGSKPVRLNQAFLADAIGTMAGAALGTSTVTTYVESASGVAQGGRSGLTAAATAVVPLPQQLSSTTPPSLVYVRISQRTNSTAFCVG